MTPKITEMAKESTALVERIRPILAGHAPPLQGLVVAELMAIWLAGHDPSMRDGMLKLQLDTMNELLPLWHDVLHKRRDA